MIKFKKKTNLFFLKLKLQIIVPLVHCGHRFIPTYLNDLLKIKVMVSILITVLVWYIYHRSWMINKKKENCTFSLCPCFGSLQAFVSLPVSLLIHSSVCVLSHVWLFAALWTVACQVPLSLGFSSQEYWSRLSFPSPGDLPDPGIEPKSPALAGGIFTSDPFRFNLKRSILTYKHLLSTLESWIKEKK